MSHHDHCHEGSCCAHEHHHHHDDCCHHHHSHGHDDFARLLLEAADEAWMDVLKEKIKDQIRKHNGKNLDALAQLIAESNNDRWKSKLGLQNSVGEFRAKLNSFFKK